MSLQPEQKTGGGDGLAEERAQAEEFHGHRQSQDLNFIGLEL